MVSHARPHAEPFHEIRQHIPGFTTTTKINKNMDKFAKLWPDTLSTRAPARDLDYEADVTLPRMVASVCSSSSAPLRSSAARIASFPTSKLNGSA